MASASTHPTRPSVYPTCTDVLSEAVALQRGEFLAGFALRDSSDFDV